MRMSMRVTDKYYFIFCDSLKEYLVLTVVRSPPASSKYYSAKYE